LIHACTINNAKTDTLNQTIYLKGVVRVGKVHECMGLIKRRVSDYEVSVFGMKKNGLARPHLIFAIDMVSPGRHTTSGRADISRKESKHYQIALVSDPFLSVIDT
jgi:hypothetical protein